MRMTQEQFNAIQMRNSPKSATPQKGCDKESKLHEQVFNECRRRGWIALHGSMAERTSRTEGEPDFEIWADGGRTFHVELKTRTGKLSPAQFALKHQAEGLGHVVHVIRDFTSFIELVK